MAWMYQPDESRTPGFKWWKTRYRKASKFSRAKAWSAACLARALLMTGFPAYRAASTQACQDGIINFQRDLAR